MMKKVILWILAVALASCADQRMQETEADGRMAQPGDTAYTQQAAMSVYGYQPERALRIIDSAVVVGNLSEVWGDVNRARIYSQSQMGEELDSLLGGPAGVRLDTAQAIAERLLEHDSVRDDPKLRQDVLEILIYTARKQEDSVRWLQRSRELVEACRKDGKETKALRTEAELAAALYYAGQQEESLARLDSVIEVLSEELRVKSEESSGSEELRVKGEESPVGRGKFNELDAFIIASKRKIGVLNSMGRYAETLLVSRRIVELLDDYERNPDRYHDGTYREPKNETKRADYIRFYRSQAQNFITSAYAALGSRGSMEETLYEVERTVRDATAREHLARYTALERQMEAERQRSEAGRAWQAVWMVGIIGLLAVLFAVFALYTTLRARKKNRLLVREITEALDYKQRYEELNDALWRDGGKTGVKPGGTAEDASDMKDLTDAELYEYLDHIIRLEKLYLSPAFGRQTLCDRFHLDEHRVGAAFGTADGSSLAQYIRNLRVEHACRLLTDHPGMSITKVGEASGFTSISVFSRSFKEQLQMSPMEFRELKG